jgi:hypothetical protein
LPELDWKRIEAELDAARPGTPETRGRGATDQVLEAPARTDEDGILRHIANALRWDKVQ